jgi:hypothetical protein
MIMMIMIGTIIDAPIVVVPVTVIYDIILICRVLFDLSKENNREKDIRRKRSKEKGTFS